MVKGHILNEEDLKLRRHILNLLCQLETTFTPENSFEELPEALKNYKRNARRWSGRNFRNTQTNLLEKGEFSIRKCSHGFFHEHEKMLETRLFSRTVYLKIIKIY